MSESNDHANLPVQSQNAQMSLSPRERYDRDIETAALMPDSAQAQAIDHMERLYRDLANVDSKKPSGLFNKVLRINKTNPEPIRGIYLWGRVGRGKTYIVDTFFDCLATKRKLRIHFHSFMRKIHKELKLLNRESDPLAIVGKQWASEIDVLCLDEFHVGDITDAMLLGNLLRALFGNGVSLITTSNEAPQNLYRDGLQRQQFLPAIALLEKHLEVFELAGELDYRLRALEQAGIYYTPHSNDVEAYLRQRFIDIAPSPGEPGGAVDVDGRPIQTIRHAEGVVWFDFQILCAGARSTGDYIEIALCHHTIVLSDVPIMDKDTSDAARRFINLIDELYDRNVKLIISAAAEAEKLYAGTRLAMPFKRTVSRLREMQSHEYLARPHICD
ncbi:MAG: cell division protein ZapE [Gammaproteobacteria bacterium]|jgi:cell division protein ZapE